MTPPGKALRRIHPSPSRSTEIGRWLWALSDTRLRTLASLDGLEAPAIDWQPPWGRNTIGSLLYHLAVIEASWLYEDLLQELPADFEARFPYDVREDSQTLVTVRGVNLEAHLERLAWVRRKLAEHLSGMSLRDFHRSRSTPEYTVTPAWVVHHLIQHEAEHRGQIGEIRTAWRVT
jgi:uncharacterized damage-inducible protein DinB